MKAYGLTKRFGEKTVFSSLSLEATEGKITAVTGPSGCGKTTLLRVLSGLDKDFEGVVETPESFSFAFQEPRLFEGATVIENVDITGAKRDEARYILKELGLDQKDFPLYPSELSGGMAKRVSLARCLCFEADAYFIDEPLEALDEDTKKTVSAFLIKYLKGKTAVISTHDLKLADMADENIKL